MATAPQPNPYAQPTQWNFNPMADTSLDIEYGDSTTQYGSTTQPYGGYANETSLANWRNPTSWANSLVVGTYQEYYGGPSYVPLNGAPTQWFPNAQPDNEAGQYDPNNSAYANLWTYDGVINGTPIDYGDATVNYGADLTYGGLPLNPLVYDSTTREYDGMNGQSFVNWRNPTAWTPISGGNSQ